MQKAFVTGASGFIGNAVARELLRDGVAVRVLMRHGADRSAIQGLDVEVIEGDVLDTAALARGLVGCDTCFHVAGMTKISLRGGADIRRMYDANERGAAMVLRVAAEAGCTRIVHTSTIAVLAPRKDGTPSNEDDLATLESLSIHYQRSKLLGEQKALEMAAKGAPVVIASPTAPMGPFDVKPTPTGRVVLDFLRGKMPGYMETGLNVIDVQDCARGHLLAAKLGKPGRRYILGHQNLQIREIFELLAGLTGLPAPRFKVPKAVALMAAFGSELKSRLTGKPPVIPLAGVRMAMKPMWYDNSRALSELGLQTRPVSETLRRAASWFVAHNHAKAPPTDLGSWE